MKKCVKEKKDKRGKAEDKIEIDKRGEIEKQRMIKILLD